jgi:hypothetical protein
MKKIIAMFLVLFMLIGCGSEVSEQEPDPVEKPTEYSIGQNVNFDSGLVFRVESTRSDNGKEYFEPDEGNEYLYIKVRIENKGEDSYNSSSIMSYSLRDSDGLSYDSAIFAETLGDIDQTVLVGDVILGEVAFEVPKNFSGDLYLYFTVDIVSDPIKIKIK